MRFFLIIGLIAAHSHFAPPACGDPKKSAKEYQALLAEFEQEGGVRIFAKRFLTLAENNIADPAGVDALLWIVDKVPGRGETQRAIQLLEQHHADNQKLGPACQAIAQSRTHGAERLLRQILKKNTDDAVRAQTGLYLAMLLDREATIIEQLAAEPEAAPRLIQYFGQAYGAHLRSLKVDDLANEREKVYDLLLTSFPDVKVDDQRVGEIAERALFALRNLSVGRVAPEIQGPGLNANELRLSDYRGKVVMLYFWGHW
jgi:hypothetical protein